MTNVVQLFGANGQPVNSNTNSPIYAEYAHYQVSNKYNQVKTIDVINALRDSGWEVSKTSTQRVRDESREGFQRHYAWLRPVLGKKLEVGDTEMRVLLSNSHDGTSAFRLQCALHRLVCSNGLVVSVGDFSHIAIRHTEEDIQQMAIDGAIQIAAMAPQIDQTIKRMQEVELEPDAQLVFATEAMVMAWPHREPGFMSAQRLLQTRRAADQGNSVWQVYNSIQENLVRGGLTANNGRRTRAINSPVRDVKLNRELFDLAVKKAA